MIIAFEQAETFIHSLLSKNFYFLGKLTTATANQISVFEVIHILTFLILVCSSPSSEAVTKVYFGPYHKSVMEFFANMVKLLTIFAQAPS